MHRKSLSGIAFLFFLFAIQSSDVFCQGRILVGIQVTDSISGMLLPAVQVFPGSSGTEVRTNAYGYLAYDLSKGGQETFYVCKDGYRCKTLAIIASKDTFVQVSLGAIQLQEIVISDSSGKNILEGDQQGSVLTSEKLRSMPLLLGEKDIAKALQFPARCAGCQ
jgi:hypothetical protein